MTRPYHPLTPLPGQMLRLAEDALAAGVPVEITPKGLAEGRPRYYLHLRFPDGKVVLAWVCGPDGAWSHRDHTPLQSVRGLIREVAA